MFFEIVSSCFQSGISVLGRRLLATPLTKKANPFENGFYVTNISWKSTTTRS
jgi:hypothetical protein